MPSIASHFVCAKLVAKILNINDDEFYKGNILPDIINENDSHHRIRGTFYLIPDIKYFVSNYDLTKNINLGYITHLLLDKHFLEEYIPNNVENYKDLNIFSKEKIYHDYTIINYTLVNKFNLNIDYINDIMKTFVEPLNEEKYLNNINCINTKKINEKTTILDLEKYIMFLKNISSIIANEIKKIKEENYDSSN